MKHRVFPENRVYLLDTDYRPLKFHREVAEGDQPVYPNWPASACGLPLHGPWMFCTAVVLLRDLAERIAEPCKKCFPSVHTSVQTEGDRGGVGSVNVGEGSTPPSAPTEPGAPGAGGAPNAAERGSTPRPGATPEPLVTPRQSARSRQGEVSNG